jgi:hypothetical protein
MIGHSASAKSKTEVGSKGKAEVSAKAKGPEGGKQSDAAASNHRRSDH